MRTTENANCFECLKAPHWLGVQSNGSCPLRELAEARSKLESHVCPSFKWAEGHRARREKKVRERELIQSQEGLF